MSKNNSGEGPWTKAGVIIAFDALFVTGGFTVKDIIRKEAVTTSPRPFR